LISNPLSFTPSSSALSTNCPTKLSNWSTQCPFSLTQLRISTLMHNKPIQNRFRKYQETSGNSKLYWLSLWSVRQWIQLGLRTVQASVKFFFTWPNESFPLETLLWIEPTNKRITLICPNNISDKLSSLKNKITEIRANHKYHSLKCSSSITSLLI
jgi:hypothetical protein